MAPATELTGRPGKNGNVITPVFRASFANVFKPGKAMQEGREAKYSLTMLFPANADLTLLRKAANDAAREKWGDKIPKGLRSPFRDQGEKDFEGYVAGGIFITATSEQKPGLVDAQMNDITEPKDFYSGCYAIASVRAFGYEKSGNKGVAFGLQNVQMIRDGEPLGGRTRPTDDFEPVDLPTGDAGTPGDPHDIFS